MTSRHSFFFYYHTSPFRTRDDTSRRLRGKVRRIARHCFCPLLSLSLLTQQGRRPYPRGIRPRPNNADLSPGLLGLCTGKRPGRAAARPAHALPRASTRLRTRRRARSLAPTHVSNRRSQEPLVGREQPLLHIRLSRVSAAEPRAFLIQPTAASTSHGLPRSRASIPPVARTQDLQQKC